MQKLIRKGLCCLWGGLAVSVMMPLTAQADETDNNTIRMVTYFPVPYARYNNIYVTEKLDIGTYAGDFTITAGNSDGSETSQDVSFSANDVNLRHIVDWSSLSINQNFKTTQAIFGNSNSSSSTNPTFTNLFINNITSAPSTLTTKSFHGDLSFFGTKFAESCNNLQWVDLFLDPFSSDKQSYLVCCDQSTSDKCRESCQGFENPKYTCTTSDNIRSTYSGRVQGTWNNTGGFGVDSCKCDCSIGKVTSYSPTQPEGYPAISTSLTFGERKNNDIDDENPFDYCQEACWKDFADGYVKACLDSRAPGGDAGSAEATWDYENCKCSCRQYYKNPDSATYVCIHKCSTEYSAGRPTQCTQSGGTWQDSSCSCECDSSKYDTVYADGKAISCKEKCIAENDSWKGDIQKCTSSGGTWLGPSKCNCDCGTKQEQDDHSCK